MARNRRLNDVDMAGDEMLPGWCVWARCRGVLATTAQLNMQSATRIAAPGPAPRTSYPASRQTSPSKNAPNTGTKQKHSFLLCCNENNAS